MTVFTMGVLGIIYVLFSIKVVLGKLCVEFDVNAQIGFSHLFFFHLRKKNELCAPRPDIYSI